MERVRLDRGENFDFDINRYWGVISGGGPYNVSDEENKKTGEQKKAEEISMKILNEIMEKDFPYFGACYGVGLLTKACGGVVSKEKYSEDVSATKIFLSDDGFADSLSSNLPKEFYAVVGHKEACQSLPAEAKILAYSENCPVELFKIKNNIYASQYHPELDMEGIRVRVEVYKNAGYFPPEEGENILRSMQDKDLSHAPLILKNFVKLYKENKEG